ncbi:MAG TPA: hypothetical protein VLG44_01500 [Chlamydiales bacterium]|nr:hypothetical protein [Chlamydiales bacterium]
MKTTLNNWLKEEKLKPHKSSKEEINQLFKIVERDLKDANVPDLSSDRKFITAYNAALQLTTIVLRIHGFRTNPNKAGHHRISIDALPEILGKDFQNITDYLHACRIKRNISDYTNSGEISDADALEIIKETHSLKIAIVKWIKKNFPLFSPKD